MFGLHKTRHRWVTPGQFGTTQAVWNRGKLIQYRIPAQISDTVTLRFKGRGRTWRGETGDLLLKISVDRGQDFQQVLWLSEMDARAGGQKEMGVGRGPWGTMQILRITVPALSTDGTVLCLRGEGRKSPYRWGMPLFNRPRGDVRALLKVFPDHVKPVYCSAEGLGVDDLNLEGWIYRHRDEILKVLPGLAVSRQPMSASEAADLFNTGGWRAIANILVGWLGLRGLGIEFEVVRDLKVPGQIQKRLETHSVPGSRVTRVNGYLIKIQNEFTHDPFAITAILAHELCHVIESRYLAASETGPALAGKELTEMERTVDLLVFLHQLGEFQLRVARASHQIFGYFNQTMFERMYVIIQQRRTKH